MRKQPDNRRGQHLQLERTGDWRCRNGGGNRAQISLKVQEQEESVSSTFIIIENLSNNLLEG